MPSILMIGGKDPAAAKRKRPPMPPLLGISMKAEPPKKGGDPMDEGDDASAAPSGKLSARNDAQETPAGEKAYHETGGAPAPTPESVLYHDSSETCHACEYMNGGQCDFLKMPVDDGGHCQRFEAKSEDAAMPMSDNPAEEAAEA